MDLPPSNSGLASTPKAAVLQRKESFATPRSAVTHNGVRIATGSVECELLVTITDFCNIMTSKH